MTESRKIQLIEVGPRDGLQNLKDYLPVREKLALIDGLVQAGVSHIQITSFVSPKAIPQMQDAEEVARTCLERCPQADLFALVPNLRGAQTAQRLGMKKVANVISLSESHNKANINRTRAQSLEELSRIRDSLPELEVCVDVATAFGCPFEGRPARQALLDFVGQVHQLGVRTFCLCDTIGVADPAQVRGSLTAVKAAFPDSAFQVHIHDTRNMGMVNTLAAIECGADGVQSTLGGLGGLPLCPRRLGQHRHRGSGVHAPPDGLRHRHRLRPPAGPGQVLPRRRARQLQQPPHPYRSEPLLLSPEIHTGKGCKPLFSSENSGLSLLGRPERGFHGIPGGFGLSGGRIPDIMSRPRRGPLRGETRRRPYLFKEAFL